jgi:hypothetical protein
MDRASLMRLAVSSFLFIVVLVSHCILTVSQARAQVLDRIEIVETPKEAEIHIVFNTRVLYLRHTPSDQGDLVRVFLDFPELDRSRRLGRELAASPPSDLVPKFTVTFPDQATNGLSVLFSKPVRFKVSQRDIRRSSRIVIAVKLDGQKPPSTPMREAARDGVISPPASKGLPFPAPTPPKTPTPPLNIRPFRPGMDLQKYADDLMKQGRAALASEENEKAVQIFNAALNLPPNKYSQEAQELVGLARERNGEITKAKAEYEHYLKAYPSGDGAARVRERLAALAEVKTQMAQRKTGDKQPKHVEETSVYGSIYEYYYGGYSQQKIKDKQANQTTTLNNHDQSLSVTAFDFTARHRADDYDNKLVVRGTQSLDLLATDDTRRNISRLRAAYVEHARQDSYLLRVGRQPGNIGGILDYRFDGAWLRYTVAPQLLNVNLVGGLPRQFSLDASYVPDDPRNFRADFKRHFYGINLDLGPVAEAWSGNTYYINQVVNGVVDRRAVGGELRYASNGKNAYSLVDYDISYGVLNVAMLNGSWVTEGGTTFTLLLDHRETPYLTTTNALLGSGFTSIDDVFKSENESVLRQQAKAVTATSDLFLAGVLHPVTENWQLGGDVRMNRISGTSATNCLVVTPGTSIVFQNPNAVTDAPCSLQALPGTGNIWTYTVQAIGSHFPFESSTFVANGSYISSPSYQGQSLTLNSLGRFGPKWQLDTFVILYHQKDSTNVHLYRVTPSLRLDYRFHDGWTFEAAGGVEKTMTDSPTQRDSTLREFFFFGLRWDFS